MYKLPDYKTARQDKEFWWGVDYYIEELLRELAGVPIREFNLDPEAGIKAYKYGRPLIRELYGEDAGWKSPCTPAVSYGHVNALGSDLVFPEGGEVGHTPIYSSLDEGIAALQKPVDFAKSGMVPFYIDYRRRLKEAFPGEAIRFGFKFEGPVTTAWELRGEEFFMDIYDYPEKSKEFLRLVTQSILDYHDFLCKLDGIPSVNPNASGMADDIASMIPPLMWGEFVIPYWRQYFSGMTTGYISAHVEDLRPEHLNHLEEVGLRHYEPAVSGKLNPKIISAECRVPFSWKLVSWHFPSMDCTDIADIVYQSAADGASDVCATLGAGMGNKESAEKVKAFTSASREVTALLELGMSREDIGSKVSPSGREKLWEHWPE